MIDFSYTVLILLIPLVVFVVVGLFGNRIHVVTRDPAGTTVRAQTLLAQGGLPKAGIQIVAPELEDVFIAMLGDVKNG